MRGASRYISPNGFKHEDDVREFVRHAIKNPAKDILSHYFQHSEHPTTRRVTFRSAGVGPAPQQVQFEVDEDDMSPEALPNRWGIRIDRQGKGENCFFGKFRVPYQVAAEMLRSVLAEHPGDDFFTRLNTSPAEMQGQLPVATVLCEAFHDMIQWGVLSAFIVTGEAFIFLHVSETDPSTLDYFPVFFDSEKGMSQRHLESTAVAYLCTFSMFVAERDRQNEEWIKRAQACLTTWPFDYDQRQNNSLSPGPSERGEGDDDGESQTARDPPPRRRSPTQRH
ncbi:hypothetical protein B0J18DRAFT_441776 [Chaetomium sp. MPI-SDFR-AT-0129]|nr:hypothetical protein B0J18DRAFT_441776 [Chaetomium sp. MPI-SDFR-AT-0129]